LHNHSSPGTSRVPNLPCGGRWPPSGQPHHLPHGVLHLVERARGSRFSIRRRQKRFTLSTVARRRPSRRALWTEPSPSGQRTVVWRRPARRPPRSRHAPEAGYVPLSLNTPLSSPPQPTGPAPPAEHIGWPGLLAMPLRARQARRLEDWMTLRRFLTSRQISAQKNPPLVQLSFTWASSPRAARPTVWAPRFPFRPRG
jgi:hypothetical protein